MKTMAKAISEPTNGAKSAVETELPYTAHIRICGSADLLFHAWNVDHRCRVQVQRSGITRTRPAIREGWMADVSLMVNLPGYISSSDLLETATMAGKVIGVGDFRPSYGRFQVVSYEV